MTDTIVEDRVLLDLRAKVIGALENLLQFEPSLMKLVTEGGEEVQLTYDRGRFDSYQVVKGWLDNAIKEIA